MGKSPATGANVVPLGTRRIRLVPNPGIYCKRFWGGNCKAGNKCRFLHGSPTSKPVVLTAAPPKASAVAPSAVKEEGEVDEQEEGEVSDSEAPSEKGLEGRAGRRSQRTSVTSTLLKASSDVPPMCGCEG